MKDEIKRLREEFRRAKTKAERDRIDSEIERLSSNANEFASAMLEDIREVNKEVEEIVLKDKLKEVLPSLSVSYIAKTYFHKTPQWFYQRLNGNLVNGKQAGFTGDELKVLANALSDISNKIQKSVALVV